MGYLSPSTLLHSLYSTLFYSTISIHLTFHSPLPKPTQVVFLTMHLSQVPDGVGVFFPQPRILVIIMMLAFKIITYTSKHHNNFTFETKPMWNTYKLVWQWIIREYNELIARQYNELNIQYNEHKFIHIRNNLMSRRLIEWFYNPFCSILTLGFGFFTALMWWMSNNQYIV